jgi:uncharacterized GH25 family protein
LLKTAARITLVLLFAPLLLAHDFYIMPEQFSARLGDVLKFALHNGDSFPESEVSPVLERVREVQLLSANAKASASNLRVESKAIAGEVQIAAAGNLILTARTIPFAFSLKPAEFESYLSEEGLQHVIQWRKEHGTSSLPGRERYSKFAKALITGNNFDDFHTKPAGLVIEIVPEVSPPSLKPGDSLPIQILFRGKPDPGIQVESAWVGSTGAKKVTIVGRTNAAGRILVPLPSPGKWRLHAVHMEQCADQAIADWESSWTSLTFETKN